MLTRKQKAFYDKLKQIVLDYGYFPSVREIGKLIGLSSPATVHSYLQKLYENGYLKKFNNKWELSTPKKSIPLIGIVPAGDPIEIFEQKDEDVEIPEWMIENTKDIFAFRVKGNSMIDAYIKENDIIILKKTSDAENGEMIIAVLPDNTITLKRLKIDKNKRILMPENPEFSPIETDFLVVGKVIAVLRKYR